MTASPQVIGHNWFFQALLVGILACWACSSGGSPAVILAGVEAGQTPPAEKAKPNGIGQILELDPIISAETLERVNRVTQALKADARKQDVRAYLILKIQDGPSRFGDVRELAKFLTEGTGIVRTVAWIPRDLRGVNVLIPLACHEIIGSARAGIGDIGRGSDVDADVRSFAQQLAQLRRNPMLSEALVTGMLERDSEVLWIRIKTGAPPVEVTETRVVLAPEFEKLVQNKGVIEERRTLKPAHTLGLFMGARCRDANVLYQHLIEEESEIPAHYPVPLKALKTPSPSASPPKVARIQVHGVIDPLQEEYVHRQIERQILGGVTLLIIEIDSPGGFLDPCTRLANRLADLESRKVRTVAFVPSRAISGGAIVAFGCDEVYLSPNAVIGDAGPIEIRKGREFHAVPEKILSALVEHLKIIAQRKKRPPALLAAMADKNLQVFRVVHKTTGEITYKSEHELREDPGVWQQGPLVTTPGMLLTMNGARAHELQLAEAPVKDLEELKMRLGLPIKTSLPALAPRFVDRLVFFLNSPLMTVTLLIIGGFCLYLELHAPSGLLLIGTILCFALFFWSRFLGGTADLLEIMLFLIGAILLALDLFVIPGFGVFGVSGGLLMLVSLVLAGQTFYIPVTFEDYQQLGRTATMLGVTMTLFCVLVFSMSRFLPKSRYWDKLILVPPGAHGSTDRSEPQLDPDLFDTVGKGDDLLGHRGVAFSTLRPAGRVQLGEKIIDVISEGPFIEKGEQVEIIARQGNRIIVRKV